VPATGISLGLERIVEVVQEHGLLPTPGTVAEVLVALFPETVGAGARLAGELRRAGVKVDLSLQPERGVGDQLKRADRKGIPLAVIVGAAELAEGRAAVKDLGTGEQTTHEIDELPEVVRARLAGRDQASAGGGSL